MIWGAGDVFFSQKKKTWCSDLNKQGESGWKTQRNAAEYSDHMSEDKATCGPTLTPIF